MNISITYELRQWLYDQDEETSTLIRTLLEAERQRRAELSTTHEKPTPLPKDAKQTRKTS